MKTAKAVGDDVITERDDEISDGTYLQEEPLRRIGQRNHAMPSSYVHDDSEIIDSEDEEPISHSQKSRKKTVD